MGSRLSHHPAPEDMLEHQSEVFLSTVPATRRRPARSAFRCVIRTHIAAHRLFGICLGTRSWGRRWRGAHHKDAQGHRPNHPVKDFTTGKVEIVSMNHGFAVDGKSLPDGVEETHISLFDGTNCGLRLVGKPVFSVQHHPEASPGPQDSHYLFRRFMNMVGERKGLEALAER